MVDGASVPCEPPSRREHHQIIISRSTPLLQKPLDTPVLSFLLEGWKDAGVADSPHSSRHTTHPPQLGRPFGATLFVPDPGLSFSSHMSLIPLGGSPGAGWNAGGPVLLGWILSSNSIDKVWPRWEDGSIRRHMPLDVSSEFGPLSTPNGQDFVEEIQPFLH